MPNPSQPSPSAAAPPDGTGPRPTLSVVTPAFNEQTNLPRLHERLCATLDPLGVSWEWIVVDDHSSDSTFDAVRALMLKDPRVRGLRLSRNSGSHTAIRCGMNHAGGACAVIMAADIQDPPETLPRLLEQWKQGFQVVWAVREAREGETHATRTCSRLYYFIMRHVVGIKEIPSTGADFFLLDRAVVDALRQFGESNASIMALISWAGFRQSSIEYVKNARTEGKSGWSMSKKIKLALDSMISFSYLPIRVMSVVGFIISCLGFVSVAYLVYNAYNNRPVEGWTSIMVVIMVLSGFQMLMLGILGEYLWRALDESRNRPKYLIEDAVNLFGDGQAPRPLQADPAPPAAPSRRE